MSNTHNTKNDNKEEVLTNTNKDSLPPDIFERGRIAEQMCQLIVDMKAEAISPLALDGKWGCGKSTHALRMKKCFENHHQDQVKCIYWNASAEDYSENPLLSFIVFLYQNVTEENRAKFKANSLRVLGTCFRQGLYNVTNQIFKNLIFVDIQEACKSVISALEQAEIERGDIVATQFGKELDGIAAESDRLKAAEKLLLSVGREKELIVIIDELDRCRPDFALKMLESIKHLFATENCKFLLVMNKDSMASSVNHLYGLGEDESFIYLNKYINRTFQLPNSLRLGFSSVNCAWQYFTHLMGGTVWSNSLIEAFVTNIINIQTISLREIDKIVSTIKFMEKVNKSILVSRIEYSAFFACFIAYLFSLKQDFAMQIAERKASTADILEDLGWDTNPMRGSLGRKKPVYIENLEPLLDFYFATNTTEQNKVLEKHSQCKYISDIEDYSELFKRWMGYCSFMR